MGFDLSTVHIIPNYEQKFASPQEKYSEQEKALVDIKTKCQNIIQPPKVILSIGSAHSISSISPPPTITKVPENATTIQQLCIKLFLEIADTLKTIKTELEKLEKKRKINQTEIAEVNELLYTNQLTINSFNFNYKRCLVESKNLIEEFESKLKEIKHEFKEARELSEKIEKERQWISPYLPKEVLPQHKCLSEPLQLDKVLQKIKMVIEEEEKQLSTYQSLTIIPLKEYHEQKFPQLEKLFYLCDFFLLNAVTFLFRTYNSHKNALNKSWITNTFEKTLANMWGLPGDNYFNPQLKHISNLIPGTSDLNEILQEQLKVKLDLDDSLLIHNMEEAFEKKYPSDISED